MKEFMRNLFCTICLAFASIAGFGQFDLTITPAGVTLPVSGCYLSSNELVRVVVVNNQGTPYSGTFNISYSINGGTWVVETVTTSMPGNGTYIYTFSTTGDFSACQIHDLDLAVYDVNDVNHLNDSVFVTRTSDCAPVVGWIDGPDTLCEGLNSGNLVLTGYTGNPADWISSTDGGAMWTNSSNPSDTEPYLNIATETIYQAIVGSPYGLCPSDTTASDTIRVFPQTVPGVLPADFNICDNGNGGFIDLTGYTGDVIFWLESSDNGTTWDSIANINDTLWYGNLTDTTMYQAVVQSGICPADTTGAITLTLIPGSDAGWTVGEGLVCNFENDSSIYVTNYFGNVIDWIYAADTGNIVWNSTGVTDSVYSYQYLLENTIFGVLVQEGSCPPDTAFHSIVVLPLNVSAGPDQTIFEGDSVQLTGNGGISYLWSPDQFINDVTYQNPWVWPEVTTTYYLEVTDGSGCVDTASVVVTVVPNVTDLLIPNLITPNGDGYNDYWEISNIQNYPDCELYVFNAYGQEVYSSAPYNNDWYGTFNGSNLPDGTYFYVLRLNDPNIADDPIQGVLTVIGNE